MTQGICSIPPLRPFGWTSAVGIKFAKRAFQPGDDTAVGWCSVVSLPTFPSVATRTPSCFGEFGETCEIRVVSVGYAGGEDDHWSTVRSDIG